MKPQLREGLHAFSSFWLCYRKYTTTSPVFVYAHLQVGDTSASYPYNSCILCLAMCDDFSSCPFRILMLFSIHTEDTNAYAIVLKIKEETNYRPHLHSNTIWHDAINSHRRNGEEQKKKKIRENAFNRKQRCWFVRIRTSHVQFWWTMAQSSYTI